MFLGKEILNIFSITIGILFFVMGIAMALGKGEETKPTKVEEKSGINSDKVISLSIVPLALPMTARPGTLVFAIVYFSSRFSYSFLLDGITESIGFMKLL